MTEGRIVTARITGRVQGVSYRAWTRDKAQALGLDGWVRNEPDGAVSALFSGTEDKVDKMIAALWHGPSAADVEDVQTEPSDEPAGQDFKIMR